MGCEKRYVGCHSECETYLKWKEEHDRLKAIESAERMKEVDRTKYEVDRAQRARKATGRR